MRGLHLTLETSKGALWFLKHLQTFPTCHELQNKKGGKKSLFKMNYYTIAIWLWKIIYHRLHSIFCIVRL